MNKKSLLTIFLIVFVDLIGIGIAFPVLPLILFNPEFPIQTELMRNVLVGLLIACYPLAQFLGAPILGKYSDRFGRRPILMLSVFGTFVGYAIFAFGVMKANLTLMIIGRLLDGFTGGNVSVAHSAIADISSGKEKTKNFGLIGMAFGLGFILGPFIGGALSDPSKGFTHATPFWAASGLALINLALIYFLFPETSKHRIHRKIHFFDGILDLKKAFSYPELKVLFTVILIQNFGWAFFTQFYQLFLHGQFGMTALEIGRVYAFIGLCIAISQGLVVRTLASKFRPDQILRVCLFVVPVVLFLMPLQTTVRMLFVLNALLALFFSSVMPNTSTLTSNTATPEAQGEVLGLQQSIISFSQAVPPLVAGLSLNFGVSAPLFIASILMLVSWLIFVFFYKHDREKHHF